MHRRPRAMDRWSLVVSTGSRRIGRRIAGAGAGVLILLVAVVLTAGVAAARWSSAGHGSGAATTDTVSATLTVTASTGLYPGATVATSVTVRNTSSYAAMTVTSLTGGSASVQTQGKAAGCTAAGVVTFTAGTLPGTTIPPGGSQIINGTVSMTTAAADACQGAVFSIPVNVAGRAG